MARPRTKQRPKSSFFNRHWHLKHFLVGLCVILIGLVVILVALVGYSSWREQRRQHGLAPFYDTAGLSLAGPMGQVVRQEPLNINVAHGSAERILYRTQRANGTTTFSSGMVFIPDNNKTGTPRPVVAWAHGTVGMGDQCAPSRTDNPISNIGWVSQMLAKGWVVTATDYAGLGTPGTEGYLIGGDEARDVLNSVRAARDLSAAHAGNRFAIFGHSQGGHSAIFGAAEAAAYAPELHLVGTAAAAPAAELLPILDTTSTDLLGWAIGPEILTAWPATYPSLDPQAVTTTQGYKNYQRIANQCILQAVLGGQARSALKQQFFKTDISKVPAWRGAAQAQTAPVLPSSQPLLVAESLADTVVPPSTTALYMQHSCQAGSDLTTLWVDKVSHPELAEVVAPQVIGWLADRFAGVPAGSNCSQPLPVTPASVTTE
ncbi:MAG TPA: lipase family protein [Candidatus Saccharimonadales bacterium]|nr:lipase family protein [Candidatus Saccharimonadales bacterium]